jgi:hypothetical protein
MMAAYNLSPPPRPGDPFQSTPSRDAVMDVMEGDSLEDAKEQERARTRVLARAAVGLGREFADARGQGSDQRVPDITADTPQAKIGTGPAAVAERPTGTPATGGTPAKGGDYYGRVKATKDSRGRITFSGPEEAMTRSRAGSESMNYGQAIMEAGDPAGSTQDVVGTVSGSAGTVSAQPGRAARVTERTSPKASEPYSRKLRELIRTMEPVDLADPGTNWTFRGGLEAKAGESTVSPEGMGSLGAGGAREGFRRLSGIEQATERRRWLEGRADEEQALELARAKVDLGGAQTEQAMRQAQLPPPDPLELARIEAEGRYGDTQLRVEGDIETRRAAAAAYSLYAKAIEENRALLETMEPNSPEAQRLEAENQAYQQYARDLANILGGHAVRDPRTDPFAALLGLTAGPAATGRPAGEPR